MSNLRRHDCPDCGGFDRREFLKTGAAAAAVTAGGLLLPGALQAADEKEAKKKKMPKGETLVQQLYSSLSDEQKQGTCFSFDDPLRQKVNNNWFITKSTVSGFKPEQQELIREIFNSLHSAEYREAVMKQVEHDNGKDGFGRCAIALFGEPGSGNFEFVLSGRHVTRRCDGDSVEGAAFGGPIFYGHAAQGFNEKPDHPGNVYWYQAKRANELYQALDGKQQKIALQDDARAERETATVNLSGKTDLAGLPFSELSSDQKALAMKVMADVLAPFRKRDAKEAMKLIEKNGIDNLHITYAKNLDIGNDGVWDVWQIEGPAMVWFFRGNPHVHTWVHVRESA